MTNPSNQSRWWRLFSILIAVLLIGIILATISLEEILNSLVLLDIKVLLVAFILNIVVVLLMAYRWLILYNVMNHPPKYLTLVKVTFVSIFFNTILPSIVGGDVYRTIALSRGKADSGHAEESLSVIFVDRIIGLVGLMLLGCLGLMLNREVEIPSIVTFLTVLLLIIFILILLCSMYNPVYQFLLVGLRWLPDRYFQIAKSILNRIHANIALYRPKIGLLVIALMISFVQRFCWLLAGFVTGQALHLNLSLITFVVFLPIIEIIRLIPLTIQGIGVREGLFIIFFGVVGVSNSDAVLLATLIYLMPTLIGLLSGLIYLLDNVSGIQR